LQTPVFLLNSRLGRFSAARFGSLREGVHLTRAPLLPKLRGHFAEFLLHKSLEHLRLLASPTCVRLRYGQPMHSPPRLFSAACLNGLRKPRRAPSPSDLGYPGLLPPGNAYLLRPGLPPPGSAYAPASPLRVMTHIDWCRNVDLLPIAYALRPRLRDRLTRGG
jgi:hypothetical protein